jgi:hypothetical protein
VLVYLKKKLGTSMERILHVVFYLQWNVEDHAKDYKKVVDIFIFFHHENPLASSNLIDFINLVKFRFNSIEIG